MKSAHHDNDPSRTGGTGRADDTGRLGGWGRLGRRQAGRTGRAGRLTHAHEGELVVFLIGMRIRKPWRPDLWLPVFAAMPRMLRELEDTPGSGLLGYEYLLAGPHPTVLQYWESADKLYAYAADGTGRHLPAWKAFNRRARTNPGAVGIWHETYVVERAESVYNNSGATPGGDGPVGLAKATGAVPITPEMDRGRRRLRGARAVK